MGHHKLHICERLLMKLCSTQLLVQVFVIVCLLPLVRADLNSDKQALQAFAAAVPHGSKLQWDNSTNICTSWVGITCNSDGTRVVAVELCAIGLTGPIPSNTLGRLNALRVLSLGSNSLNGSLPSDFSYLFSLRSLILQHNRFTSNIPEILPKRLRVLDLSDNFFTGYLPAPIQFLSELDTLNVHSNHLSGPLPYLHLPKLIHLNLSSNNFSGATPYLFKSFPNSSFLGNPHLCGDPLDPCPTNYMAYFIDFLKWFIDFLKWLANLSFVMFFIIFKDRLCAFFMDYTNRLIIYIKHVIKSQKRTLLSYTLGVRIASRETFETYWNDGAIKLGDGSMGDTYVTVNPITTAVVKILKHVEVDEKTFVDQMDEIAEIGVHGNISTVYWSEYSDFRKVIVYHYYERSNLKTILHGDIGGRRNHLLDLKTRVYIALGVAKAIAYIHEKGSVHANLKASNIFIKSEVTWEIAVTEHGLALLTKNKFGGYLAPEVFSIGPSDKSDVFCFGILLLELLTGKLPIRLPRTSQMCDVLKWVDEECHSSYFYDHVIRNSTFEHRKFMLETALTCTNPSPLLRPDMYRLVDSLARLHKNIRGQP